MEGDGSEDGDGPAECHGAAKQGESSEAAKGVPPPNTLGLRCTDPWAVGKGTVPLRSQKPKLGMS